MLSPLFSLTCASVSARVCRQRRVSRPTCERGGRRRGGRSAAGSAVFLQPTVLDLRVNSCQSSLIGNVALPPVKRQAGCRPGRRNGPHDDDRSHRDRQRGRGARQRGRQGGVRRRVRRPGRREDARGGRGRRRDRRRDAARGRRRRATSSCSPSPTRRSRRSPRRSPRSPTARSSSTRRTRSSPTTPGLALSDSSGAEELARLLPRSKVVKAFNTLFAGNTANPQALGFAARQPVRDRRRGGQGRRVRPVLVHRLPPDPRRPADGVPRARGDGPGSTSGSRWSATATGTRPSRSSPRPRRRSPTASRTRVGAAVAAHACGRRRAR